MILNISTFKIIYFAKKTLKFMTEEKKNKTLPKDPLLDANISTKDRNKDTLERVLLTASLLFPSQA